MRKPIIITTLLGVFLLAMTPAEAMRCGSKIVKKGDLYTKIRKFCGEPDAIQRRSAFRGGGVYSSSGVTISNSSVSGGKTVYGTGYSEEIVIEEWTYNRGNRKLVRVIRFENGRVVNIESEGYGY